MKALKILGTIIVSFFLFIFVFAYSLSFILKNAIQDELFVGIIKNSIIESYMENNKGKDTEELDNILRDSKADDIIGLLLDGYDEYQKDGSYDISEKDLDMIKDFLKENKKEINKFTDDEFDDEFINREVTEDNINKFANEMYKDLDKELGESANSKELVSNFKESISTKARIELLICILICIGLIMLINWSLIKWLIPTSVVLIINSLFVFGMYGLLLLMKSAFIKDVENGDIIMKDISFNSVLIFGIVEFVLAIVFIIVNSVLKNRKTKEVVAQ